MDDNVNSGETRYLDKDGKELTEAEFTNLQAGKTVTGKKGKEVISDDRSENTVSSKG